MDDSISEDTIIAIRVTSTDKLEVVCTTQPYLFKQDLKKATLMKPIGFMLERIVLKF